MTADLKFRLKSGDEYFASLEIPTFSDFMDWLEHENWFVMNDSAFRVDSIESVIHLNAETLDK